MLLAPHVLQCRHSSGDNRRLEIRVGLNNGRNHQFLVILLGLQLGIQIQLVHALGQVSFHERIQTIARCVQRFSGTCWHDQRAERKLTTGKWRLVESLTFTNAMQTLLNWLWASSENKAPRVCVVLFSLSSHVDGWSRGRILGDLDNAAR